MKRTLTVVFAFLALLGLGAAIYAQRSHESGDPAQHHINRLTKALSLTQAQQQQATTIFNDVGAAEKSLHQQMRGAHENLQAAVQKNDAAAIDQAAKSMGSLQSQMISAHAKASAAFRQILTPDQLSKLDAFEKQHHGMRHRGMHGPEGPGGPDGPPPPPDGGNK
ncbi:MAG TPA: periplasmic heavy metal sensor [Verrucomicrobiae bacterium]|jgi:Spy/CpxP family protein refolding chaperone|nr:periplasmic heavy metal sensor [Verrucomicrobiae bacterium]